LFCAVLHYRESPEMYTDTVPGYACRLQIIVVHAFSYTFSGRAPYKPCLDVLALMSQFSLPLTLVAVSTHSPTPPSLTSLATALSTPHLDYIHELQYDFYSRRLVTCSGDSTLTIYSLSPSNTWLHSPGSMWQAHKGVVWSVSWAHPEYGQLIASAGAEHMVHVWEEQSSADSAGGEEQERG